MDTGAVQLLHAVLHEVRELLEAEPSSRSWDDELRSLAALDRAASLIVEALQRETARLAEASREQGGSR